VAALSGSGGKTLVSVGLIAALRRRGHPLYPFKKGPDYIDAAWLRVAAGRPCRNLDLFLMGPDVIRGSFQAGALPDGIAVIEGNRGLFDGMDAEGSYSTAEIAKLVTCPVLLVVDCTKTTRTLAPMILGCKQFDAGVDLRGVVLNRVSGPRHESVLREAVERYTGVPVLGAIPRLSGASFPERHLGLIPPDEHEAVPEAVERARSVVEKHLDMESVERLARSAPPLDPVEEVAGPILPTRLRVGVFRDAAFQFYYPENLEALARQGGEVVEVSPLKDSRLPDLDALYIGGGFPETSAEALSANGEFRQDVREAAHEGMPVYAECGGAIYLGENLTWREGAFPMAGVLPVRFGWDSRPQGHGYAIIEVTGENPFYPRGITLRGHEFHYSRVLHLDEERVSLAFAVRRGHGVDGRRDGICLRRVLATYCHVHALGVTEWAGSVVKAAAAS
jgi:cobyrinic acid a,c-diamide synthase